MTVFLILHYIALEETVNCVNSILNQVEGEKKIVIVDNASPNRSIEGLIKLYKSNPDVEVLKTNENLGFARGNNFGYQFIVKKFHPDFIVVMNNDMEIKQADFITQIEKCYSEYNFNIMGPDIYATKKNYHQNPQTRKLPTISELRKNYKILYIKDKMKFLIWIKWWMKDKLQISQTVERKYKDNYINQVIENPLLHGSCYVFSKDFIARHPDECFYSQTFMYMEAEILYYQAMRDGEKMIYCPWLRVDHHEDASTDAEYTQQYKKSIFSVRCLLQSTEVFIDLMEKDLKNSR